MDAISLDNVYFSYGPHPVIQGVDLTIKKGETVCMTGENGSGKSTLLKLIIGALEPASGTVKVLGSSMHKRRGVLELGYVPQNNAISQTAFPITAREIVVMGLLSDFGFVKIPRRRHLDRAEDTLTQMGLEKYIHFPFSELSGGLQQRVMITRALIHDPEIVILDEPTAGVDKESREEFLQFLDKYTSEKGLTALIVTHDTKTIIENMNIDTFINIQEGQLHAGI